MRIGDVFLRVLAEMSGFEADVVKQAQTAGDKAGLSMGQRLSAGVKKTLAVGIGLAAGVAALALGVAAKGALDLENAIARFQSATGASADEAAAAGKTINRVAGEERTSLEAVTEAAIRVRNDIGATGPLADKLTQAFVRFARVTKQDAAGAVTAFDDILDNWGLTAADALTVMDKLLVSQHKFGGEITANQVTLAKLAPAMRAANFEIDDGIAILGLFGAKGLDSERAAAAFSKALTKVKSPAELQALITDITNTKDPFERAAKAADLFGAKAGAQLANALGGVNLDDYKISVTEAAGAVDKAADVIDSTITGKLQKALSIGSAKLREFGQAFGPGLTGFAAIASLAHATGLGGILTKAVGGSWTSVAGSSVVKAAAGRAGSMAATAYLRTLIAGDAMADAVSAGLSKVGGSRIVSAASGGLGKILGSTIGKATMLAFAGIAIIELLHELDDLEARIKQQGADIGTNVGNEIAAGSLDGLKQSRDALKQGLHDLAFIPFNELVAGDQKKLLEDQLASVEAAILALEHVAATTETAAGKLVDDTRTASAETVGAMTDIDKQADLTGQKVAATIGRLGTSLQGVGFDTLDLTDHVGTMKRRVSTSFLSLGTDAGTMRRLIGENLDRIKTAAHNLTEKLLGEAQALITGYYDPIIAQDELRVAKDQVAADKAALAATKAGTTERHQAQLTLDQSEQALDQARANLLAAGTLSAKEQSAWLAELQARYKTATGDAKLKIQSLIDKIHALQNIAGAAISISVGGHLTGTHAGGGGPQQFAEGGLVPGAPGAAQLAIIHGGEFVVPREGVPALAAFAATGGQPGGDLTIGPITVNAGSDVSIAQGRRLGQYILDEVASGLRDQSRRRGLGPSVRP